VLARLPQSTTACAADLRARGRGTGCGRSGPSQSMGSDGPGLRRARQVRPQGEAERLSPPGSQRDPPGAP
jgi:hypothetical protein